MPVGVQGVQAWDRYAYVNNNPARFNDPTGHCIDPDNCPWRKDPLTSDQTKTPITNFIFTLPGTADNWAIVATAADITALVIDASAAVVVGYGTVAGAGIPAAFGATAPIAPVTGAAGFAIAEMYVQPVLFYGNVVSAIGTGATIFSKRRLEIQLSKKENYLLKQ